MVLQASNREFNANRVEVREVGGGGARGRGEDILEISLWMSEGVKWKAEVKREMWLFSEGKGHGMSALQRRQETQVTVEFHLSIYLFHHGLRFVQNSIGRDIPEDKYYFYKEFSPATLTRTGISPRVDSFSAHRPARLDVRVRVARGQPLFELEVLIERGIMVIVTLTNVIYKSRPCISNPEIVPNFCPEKPSHLMWLSLGLHTDPTSGLRGS